MIDLPSDFSNDAKVIQRMEDIMMQMLRKNGILKGNKVYATVVEHINDTSVSVILGQSQNEEIVSCSPNMTFNTGDLVLVEFINNNSHDKFIMAVVRNGNPIEPLDYSTLPYEPVQIYRNEQNQAYRFMYGYDNPETTWFQELIRNSNNQVEEIIHEYPDESALVRTLFRNGQGQVWKYE